MRRTLLVVLRHGWFAVATRQVQQGCGCLQLIGIEGLQCQRWPEVQFAMCASLCCRRPGLAGAARGGQLQDGRQHCDQVSRPLRLLRLPRMAVEAGLPYSSGT